MPPVARLNSMMSGDERSFREWLSAYVDKYQHTPQNAEQLCAFARNNGGHVAFRLVKEKLNAASQSDAVSMQRSSSSPDDKLPFRVMAPVLQRFRSDKAEKLASLQVNDLALPMSSVPGVQEAVSETRAFSHMKLAATVLAMTYRQIAVREAKCAKWKITDFGLNGNYSVQTKSELLKCSICLELAPCLQSAGELCQERGCQGWFCRPCIQKHVSTVITDSRFSIPTIRCPACFGFVPPSCWKSFSESSILSSWRDNAADLLSMRCGGCDEPGTLLEPGEGRDESNRKELTDIAFAEVDCMSFVEKWYLFEKGSLGANDLVQSLLQLWAYAGESEEAQPKDLSRKFQSAMRLVEDEGLRAVLQLCFLKVYPKAETSCCEEPHCFRCKIQGHHEGTSCEEVMQAELPEDGGIQFCPSCGVATIKAEGCNHIICLCGENWTWEGDEEWMSTKI